MSSAIQIPVLTQARESFHSTSCPVDGKMKRDGHWFCCECWKKLSDKLRGDLARMKSGWTDSWLEACKVLKGGEVKPTVGSLFAGIGGFDLGFERAGFETVWQVEIDDYCRRVLERHFPRAKRYKDIRDCCGHTSCDVEFCERLPENHLGRVDVIAGGFPCQDISDAGLIAGLEAERSGLWREMHRIVCELRPRFVVMENVSALLERGIGGIIGKLAASGYECEWMCLPASAFGAPHIRDRAFIVAYPKGERRESFAGLFARQAKGQLGRSDCDSWRYWADQSSVLRVADGVPDRMDRLHGLGNAVVPQIAQWIAERIKEVMIR